MTKERAIKIAVDTTLGTLIAAILVLYICRNSLLHHIADRRIARMEQNYGLNIAYDKLELKGCNKISLRKLTVIPQQRDTLLTLQSLDMRFSLWSLLAGNISIKKVALDSLTVSFVKRDSISNYDFLFHRNSQEDSGEKLTDTNYSHAANTLLRIAFGLLPKNGSFKHILFTERRDDNFVSFNVPELQLIRHRFHTDIAVEEDSLAQRWTAEGELNPSARRIQASLYSRGRERILLPYIERRFGAKVLFDTLSYSFIQEKTGGSSIRLAGKSEVKGLEFYHKRVSPEVINLDHGFLDFRLNVTPRAIELDSASLVKFNALDFHPYIRVERLKNADPDKKWHVTLSVNKPWFPSQELFGSLPKGLFENLEGIQTTGQLAYHFLLDVDFSQLNQLKFESEMQTKNFHIKDYGGSYLGRMSGEFSYTAYENGAPVRTFPVGRSWEHFTPLDSIPQLLQMSVMQSEDGAFFYHRGFLPDAMREALIYDLKVKRFARGGSTISMQLVKNVFLNRNKNIARKLEEALIVWLVESQHLTSKARMFEVYLNIAEWGPMVYGIGEAAQFYFGKRPSQLSVDECIYLAEIIPKPKHFRGMFSEDGILKDTHAGYFRLIARRLVAKGLISEEQAATVSPLNVVLTGAAKAYFTPTAPIPTPDEEENESLF